MPAKIIAVIMLAFFSIHSIAQSPVTRYNDYIKDATEYLQNGDLEHAESSCKIALTMAKEYPSLRSIENLADGLMVKIRAAKLKKAASEIPVLVKNNIAATTASDSSRATSTSSEKSVSAVIIKARLFFPAAYPANNITISGEKLRSGIEALLKSVGTNTAGTQQQNMNDGMIEAYENRFYSTNYLEEDKWLFDSTLKAVKKSGPVSEKNMYLYLRAVLFYAWNLLDEKKWNPRAADTALTIIQNTINLVSANNINSPMGYYALSGFENLLSEYYSTLNDEVNNYSHALRSAEYAKRAVALNPLNAYYLRNLVTCIDNLSYASDSLLPPPDKKKFRLLKYDVADYMNSGIKINEEAALSAGTTCAINRADDLLEEGKKTGDSIKYANAIIVLNNQATTLQKYKDDAGYNGFGPLLAAVVHNKLCAIYEFYNKDSIEFREHTLLSYQGLSNFLKSKIISQRILDRLEGAYDDLASDIDDACTEDEKINLYSTLVSNIESGDNDYINSRHISYVYATCNKELGNEFLDQGTKVDSTQALNYFVNALNIFQRTELMKYYNGFSEDYAKFCDIFNKVIAINVSQNNYIMAKNNYTLMMSKFSPVYKKYGFDFYFIQHLISSAEIYGKFLYVKGKYQEAIAPLAFASYEGIKASTDSLAKIYAMPSFKDTAIENMYNQRSSYQSGKMKQVTFFVDCGGLKTKFNFYLADRAKGYEYKGIDDQVKWLKEARGCTVDTTISSSFVKLQKIAWDDNVSFTDLCMYALAGPERDTLKDAFDSGRDDAATLIAGRPVEDMKKILRFYLHAGDTQNADFVTGKILDSADDVSTRYLVSLIYFKENMGANTARLFLSDTSKVEDYRGFFVDTRNESFLSTDTLKSFHYLNLTSLDSAYYSMHPDDSLKRQIASHYISLVWYRLLSKQYGNLENYIAKSMQYDPTDLYAIGNLPHVYLFTKQFDRAKALYLKLKDQPFDKEAGLPTYKDAFLSDFKDFETAGLMNDDIRAIEQLLAEK